jgi:cell division protein FtsW
VVLFSASQSPQVESVGIFKKQVCLLIFALACGIGISLVDLNKLRGTTLAWLIGGFAIVCLVLVLIPGLGVKVNGARRWLNIGVTRLQISEFAKIAMVFVLAQYLSANQRILHTFWKGFFIPCTIVGIFAGLIIIEPDFGTAFLFGIVGITLLFLGGVRMLFLVPSIVGALSLFSVAVWLDPVRLRRITSFLDVEAHKTDGAYQLWQGILAFASGGLPGVGLGQGRQQLAFLPEAHTDFIFPIIGEELGWMFTVGVAFLFLIIFLLGMRQLRYAPNLHQFTLGAGSLLFLILQALINMGVVTGCLPTKGMSLPFISYGGANLVVMFIFVGILANCFLSWNSKKPVIRVRSH